jgi:hypothetical protein
MLTDQHRKLIKEKIKTKYNVEVENDQISNLILSEFVCELNVECEDSETELKLEGEVSYFDQFPLKLNFQV